MQLQFKETRYITKQFLSGEKVQNETTNLGPATIPAPPKSAPTVENKVSNAPKESPNKVDAPKLGGYFGGTVTSFNSTAGGAATGANWLRNRKYKSED